MPSAVTKTEAVLNRTKIPINLLKQFDADAELIRVPPGSTAGLIRVSPEIVQKIGAAQLAKMLEQANCELVIMG